ncbi:MAG: energy transducer TonB [Pyrinomonadaceae bacterium]
MRCLLFLAICLAAAGHARAQVGPGHGQNREPCHASRPTASEADDKIYTGREVTCKAVILSKPQPVFPRQARAERVQGVVRVSVVLLASGKVGEVKVIKGLPEGVSEAAIEAARKIKFTPAIKDDRRVSQRALFEYNFNIY